MNILFGSTTFFATAVNAEKTGTSDVPLFAFHGCVPVDPLCLGHSSVNLITAVPEVHSRHLTPFLRLLCWLHHASQINRWRRTCLPGYAPGFVQDVVPSEKIPSTNVVAINHSTKPNPALLCTAPGCEGTIYFTYGYTLVKCARYTENGLGWCRRCW